MRILITSIGSNTSIGVVKGLRLKFGTSVFIVGTDLYERSDSAGSYFVDRFYKIAPVSNLSQYETDFKRVIEVENIDVVIPIHDSEIMAVAYFAQQTPSHPFWAVNSPEVVAKCNDKLISNHLAEKVGLKVPKYWKEITDVSHFPVIAKRINGVSSRGVFVANTRSQLEQLGNDGLEGYMFQEFVTDATEYTVDCYSNYKGIFLGGVARKRIETKEGISTKGVTEFRPDLLEACERFLNHIAYKGASNLQFMVNAHGLNFIEINPRFSGGGILSYKAGFNSPVFTVMEATNSMDKLDCDIRYGLKMTRYWEEVFC